MSLATITILDVGHGSSAIIQSGDHICVIDAGAGATLLEYIRLLPAFKSIDSVLISHADRDHAGGLINLLASKKFDIGTIRLNSDAFKRSKLWRKLAYEIDIWEAAGGEAQLGIKKGDHFAASPLDIEVLAPRTRLVVTGPGSVDHANRRLEANSLSVVARVTLNGEPIALFPGDIDDVGLDHLLDTPEPPNLRAPVLAFPHHGGHASRGADANSNMAFATRVIDLVRPETVVFSIGRNEHSTPRPEIVAAIRAVKPDIRIACTQLSNRCAAELPVVESAHLLPLVARGRVQNACCSGTTTINVSTDASISVEPEEAAHRDFVAISAPTALCRPRQGC